MEKFHRGRLFDHIHLRVADLAQSRHFYQAVFEALGKGALLNGGETYFYGDELWVDQAKGATSRIHLAFAAETRSAVDTFHASAIRAGGTDHGVPGERSYHPGYYAAFVLDPDGNNIEAVYHGAVMRSAASVELTPLE